MLVKLGVSIGKKAASSGYLFIARQRWGSKMGNRRCKNCATD